MTDDLIKRLRALVVAVHDDLSVGDEAADEIERLRVENETLKAQRVGQMKMTETLGAEFTFTRPFTLKPGTVFDLYMD